MIKIEHIYREGNRLADYLTGLAHTLPIDVHSVSTIDRMLSIHLLYDFLEVFRLRLIVNEKYTLCVWVTVLYVALLIKFKILLNHSFDLYQKVRPSAIILQSPFQVV
ncbi:hypothetical protein LINGRAHAP2_LOCUS20748 [Linum grandiflorum]